MEVQVNSVLRAAMRGAEASLRHRAVCHSPIAAATVSIGRAS
jgi:hypothetical protein